MGEDGYTFATPLAEWADHPWAPRIVDGQPLWDDADGRVDRFLAGGLTVCRGSLEPSARQLTRDNEFDVFVSRARLVAVERRSDGLVGQLVWPWLSDVGYSERSGWLGSHGLQLVAMDGADGQSVAVELALPERARARELAQLVLDAAVADRRSGAASDERRAVLDALRLPEFDAAAERFAIVRIPGALAVRTATRGDAPSDAAAPAATEDGRDGETTAPDLADRCPDCGHEVLPHGRFCRGCGRRHEATEAPAAKLWAAPLGETVQESALPAATSFEAPESCVACAAALLARARFCRACGAPVTAAAVARWPARKPPAPLKRAARPSPALPKRPASTSPAPPKPRRGRAGAYALGCVLLIAAAAGGALLLSDGEPAPADSAARSGQPVATSTATAASTPPATPTATATADPVAPPRPFVAGRYARLGSFRTEGRAQEVVEQLAAEGVVAQPFLSDEGEGMLPAFWVVIAGPLATSADERQVKRDARRAGIKDTFVDDLAPSAAALDPAELVGTFTGELQQTNARVKRLNRTLGTTLEFSADGQTGAVTYTRPSCDATLTLASHDGAVAIYDEAITRGRCSDGGQWHVRLDGSDLLATWWREDDVTFVIGTLTP